MLFGIKGAKLKSIQVFLCCLIVMVHAECFAASVSVRRFSTVGVAGAGGGNQIINLNPNVGSRTNTFLVTAIRTATYSSMSVTSNSRSESSIVLAQPTQLRFKPAALSLSITGLALVYPNPFHFSSGTTLGYDLSDDAEIEVQLYDMAGNQIGRFIRSATLEGGRAGLNHLPINRDTLNGYELSSGVYLYFILNNGKVLAKGRMAVVP